MKTYKVYITVIIIGSVLGLFACDSIDIFDSNQEEQVNALPPDREFLRVHKTGGFAGVDEMLSIYGNGQAVLQQSFGYAEKRTVLSPPEVYRIQQSFSRNHFMQLQDSYFDPQVKDAFNYEIYYFDGKKEKTVTTNGFSIPSDLENVLSEIQRIEQVILKDGLEFVLVVERTKLSAQEPVSLLLKVTNTSEKTIILKCNSAQSYDFLATSNTKRFTDAVVWQWSATRVFAQVLTQFALAPNETRTFSAVWSGADRPTGTLFFYGKLLSWPGGVTRPVMIEIN